MSVLRRQIERLDYLIEEGDLSLREIESEFWRNGGICCPNCGVPGFTEKEEKQERRRKQRDYLIKKYEKDSGSKYEDRNEARSLADRLFRFLLGIDPD